MCPISAAGRWMAPGSGAELRRAGPLYDGLTPGAGNGCFQAMQAGPGGIVLACCRFSSGARGPGSGVAG